MSKILTFDEMLSVARQCSIDTDETEQLLFDALDLISTLIARKLKIDKFDLDLPAGTVTFGPKNPGDPVPAELEPYDTEADWE